jgi:protein TonB
MMQLRLPLTVLLGGAFSIWLFWLMWTLISQPIDVGDMLEATRIEFSRMRRDTEAATKREDRAEREPPPPAPEIPRMAFSSSGVDNNVAQLTPTINTSGSIGGMELSGGSDTDVIPLVRIAPEYPPRALSRGIEGWVQVQFTITETGAVKDAVVHRIRREYSTRPRSVPSPAGATTRRSKAEWLLSASAYRRSFGSCWRNNRCFPISDDIRSLRQRC